MPISVPSDERGPSTHAKDNTPISSLSPKRTTMAAETNVVQAVSRAPIGAPAHHDQGDGVPAGENLVFGDLFVEASITLPTGDEKVSSGELYWGAVLHGSNERVCSRTSRL